MVKTVLIPGLSAVVTLHTGPPRSDTERQRETSKKPADWYILNQLQELLSSAIYTAVSFSVKTAWIYYNYGANYIN